MADEQDELADQLSRYFSRMGRKGSKVRNQRLTAEQRKEIATKASKAAARVRTQRAQKSQTTESTTARKSAQARRARAKKKARLE
jgi:hypothetical protein